MYLPNPIPNEDLSLSEIPSPDTDWQPISRFALTYDGRSCPDSVTECDQMCERVGELTLSELRGCLYMYQRRFKWIEELPNNNQLTSLQGLIREIRKRVEERKTP